MITGSLLWTIGEQGWNQEAYLRGSCSNPGKIMEAEEQERNGQILDVF